MPEETYTAEDAAKANRHGWELVNRAGEREDAEGTPFGFLDALAYVDVLEPSDVACIVAALLGSGEDPMGLRRAVANALLCWRVRVGR